LLLQRRVAADEVAADGGEELRAGDRLEGMSSNHLRRNGSKRSRPTRFDRAQEGGAFLIGDLGQAVVGIAALEVDAQGGCRAPAGS
jgi:hypothetical protein